MTNKINKIFENSILGTESWFTKPKATINTTIEPKVGVICDNIDWFAFSGWEQMQWIYSLTLKDEK